jgi:hypothetical protein
MLAAAFAAEAQTNQIAVSSFLGTDTGAMVSGWVYGVMGPIVLGGLAALSPPGLAKRSAYTLLLGWSLAMASITASNKTFLDQAQAYYPKGAAVLAQERKVAATQVRKQAADAELKRLNAPAPAASQLLAAAKRRWMADRIKDTATLEATQLKNDRQQARQTAIEAAVALGQEEIQLRDTLLDDPSRTWAWATLFAIFAVINLAAPLAITRVLEKWRSDHPQAVAEAQARYLSHFKVNLSRGSRARQQAQAMLLLPPLIEELAREGILPEVIARLDHCEIAQKAAEHFDRAVNPRRTRRFFGLGRPPADPA